MSEEEATAEVERLGRAAMDIADGSPRDWGWAFDQVIKDRTEEIAAAADPPGALTVTADGRLVGRGVLEAIDRRLTVGRATMVEVNRRRREAGELGTKRHRKARKGRHAGR